MSSQIQRRKTRGIILQNVSPAIWSQSTSPSSYPWGDQYQQTTTLGTTELNNRAKFVIYSVFLVEDLYTYLVWWYKLKLRLYTKIYRSVTLYYSVLGTQFINSTELKVKALKCFDIITMKPNKNKIHNLEYN